MNSNPTDIFFVIESFKIFFEKVLSVISDPKGIAIQEWLKYKDLLTSKECTPQSIYSYSNTLAITIESGNANNIVKLKKQATKQIDSANTPRKLIGRRNSCDVDSPSNAKKKADQAVSTQQQSHNQGEQQANNTQQESFDQSEQHFGSIAAQALNHASNKRNESPTKRVNLNEIQQMKGLSEVASMGSKTSKQAEMFAATQKLLLTQVKACLQQFKKDSTGLDLIHDRSFSTQTVLIENNRTPYDRNVKRQNSKFIRELSIYKKGPNTQQQQQQPQQQQPSKPSPTPILDQQPQHKDTPKNNFAQPQITPTTIAAATVPYLTNPATITPSPSSTLPTPTYSTNNAYNPPSIVGITDYIKVKSKTAEAPLYSHQNSYGSTQSPVTNLHQYSSAQPLSKPVPPSYITNNHYGGSYGQSDKQPSSAGSRQDIDSLVQRILSEQKSKEYSPITPTSIAAKERLVQDILSKHQPISSTPAFNYSPSVGMKTQNTNNITGTIGASPYKTNSAGSINTYIPSYQMSASPIKGKDFSIGGHYYPYSPSPSQLNKM